MILADIDLWDLQRRHGIVTPWQADHLQPASIDLTLGNEFIADSVKHELHKGASYALAPGEFILTTTHETVYVPNGYAARVEGRSSWGRKGLLVHATAGFVDPGFRGTITLELKNLTQTEVLYLPVGERLCQITYLRGLSRSERPYGSPDLGSHYQGQLGATPSVL
jgi:dCTP deaminase